MVFVAHGAHVGHGVGRGPEPESADAGHKYSGIVVASEEPERHEVCEQCHHQHLQQQYGEQGQGEALQLPQLQRYHGHAEKYRQRYVANAYYLLGLQLVAQWCALNYVAHYGSCYQGTEICGECYACVLQQLAHERTHGHDYEQGIRSRCVLLKLFLVVADVLCMSCGQRFLRLYSCQGRVYGVVFWLHGLRRQVLAYEPFCYRAAYHRA